jgi:hypothetical protein
MEFLLWETTREPTGGHAFRISNAGGGLIGGCPGALRAVEDNHSRSYLINGCPMRGYPIRGCPMREEYTLRGKCI